MSTLLANYFIYPSLGSSDLIQTDAERYLETHREPSTRMAFSTSTVQGMP